MGGHHGQQLTAPRQPRGGKDSFVEVDALSALIAIVNGYADRHGREAAITMLGLVAEMLADIEH